MAESDPEGNSWQSQIRKAIFGVSPFAAARGINPSFLFARFFLLPCPGHWMILSLVNKRRILT
jgi:hypothetical protein